MPLNFLVSDSTIWLTSDSPFPQGYFVKKNNLPRCTMGRGDIEMLFTHFSLAVEILYRQIWYRKSQTGRARCNMRDTINLYNTTILLKWQITTFRRVGVPNAYKCLKTVSLIKIQDFYIQRFLIASNLTNNLRLLDLGLNTLSQFSQHLLCI